MIMWCPWLLASYDINFHAHAQKVPGGILLRKVKLDMAVEFAVLAVGMAFFHSLVGDSRFLSVYDFTQKYSHIRKSLLRLQ